MKQQLKDAGLEGVEEIDSASKVNRADIIRRFAPYYNGATSARTWPPKGTMRSAS